MNLRLRIPSLSFVFLFLCMTTNGCLNRLAGGTMRIDVEVYKGPLSQEPEIQWGELVGYLEEAKRGMVEVTNATLAVVHSQGFQSLAGTGSPHTVPVDVRKLLNGTGDSTPCSRSSDKDCPPPLYLHVPSQMKDLNAETATKATWCDSLPTQSMHEQQRYENCLYLRGLYIDGVGLIQEVDDALSTYGTVLHGNAPTLDEAASALREISEMAAEFRAKAFRWAVSGTSGLSYDRWIRIAIADFIVAASEYGNQLQARADSLMKQFDKLGRDRRELPLSVYLRDTQPTDFIHLYDWLEAAEGGWFSDAVADRINVVKRLFGDRFWAKINTVYASGVGKVRMAFVKDGIGNWDLKDFDSAPTELVEGYANVAKALTQRAIDVAKGSTPEGVAVSAIETLLMGAKQTMAAPKTLATSSEAQSVRSSGDLLATKVRLLLESRRTRDRELLVQYESARKTVADGASPDTFHDALTNIQSFRKDTLDRLHSLLKDQGEFLDAYAAHVTVP